MIFYHLFRNWFCTFVESIVNLKDQSENSWTKIVMLTLIYLPDLIVIKYLYVLSWFIKDEIEPVSHISYLNQFTLMFSLCINHERFSDPLVTNDYLGQLPSLGNQT